MNRVNLKRIPLRTNSFAGWHQTAHIVFFALFLLLFGVVWANLWLRSPLFGHARWPEGLLVLLAVATTVVSLSRQLPAGNVMFVSVAIACIGGGIQTLGALTAIPFGPFVYTEKIGQELL